MKVLFCHDGPLRKDENNNYYGLGHNDETFKRYYNIADDLAIAIRVHKILKSEGEMNFSKITVKPFEVFECPNISSIKGLLLRRYDAKKLLKEAVLKSDYIVARLPSMIGFLAVDFAKKYNKPYLVEVVACPWDAFWNHSFLGKIVAPYMYISTKRRVKSANYVIYVTNEFLQKRYPTKGLNIGLSDVNLIDTDEKVLEKRLDKINQTGEKVIIGTIAAVDVKYKGQQYIIEALGRLKKQGFTHLEYQLVGGGDKSYLESLAIKYDVFDQVKFLGTKSHNEVFEWLDSIDIYVQPSRQEGLPRALVEAMSRGLPAFGAKTGGIPELIDPNYIFSNTKKNIEEICWIILLFINNKEVMKNQAKRNYLESKKYDRDLIEKRRRIFFEKFRNNGK